MTDQPGDGAPKSPIDTAVEALVYAPIGLLFEGSSLLPQLVEKGRQQVTVARMMGRYAVERAGGDVAKAAARLSDQAAGILDLIGGTVTPLPPEPGPPPAPPKRAERPAGAPRARRGAAKAAARKVTAGGRPSARKSGGTAPAAAPAPRPPAPDAAELAIPDYDGLSASQVVNRLAGLAPAELEAVRAYEAAHRGRKTILSKVAQLQSP